VKGEARDLINLINQIYEVLHNDGDAVKIAGARPAMTQGAGQDDATSSC
jgi:hypothetical protein